MIEIVPLLYFSGTRCPMMQLDYNTNMVMRLAPTILGFCTAYAAGADTFGPPSDYVRPTKSGEYLFVMLTPLGKRGEQTEFIRYPDPVTDTGKTIQGSLVQRFPKSGLYRNDGSRAPLWTVDWYGDSVFLVCSHF
jgi:hypothetical protein